VSCHVIFVCIIFLTAVSSISDSRSCLVIDSISISICFSIPAVAQFDPIVGFHFPNLLVKDSPTDVVEDRVTFSDNRLYEIFLVGGEILACEGRPVVLDPVRVSLSVVAERESARIQSSAIAPVVWVGVQVSDFNGAGVLTIYLDAIVDIDIIGVVGAITGCWNVFSFRKVNKDGTNGLGHLRHVSNDPESPF